MTHPPAKPWRLSHRPIIRHQSAPSKETSHYDEATAILSLFHNFPTPQDRQIAQVDISQLLDTIDRQLLQIGAWINVIGYVTPSTSTNRIQVQAVIIWSAGAINLQQYETALVSRQTT
ncbi:hypothetical protein E4T47_02557 [Aureobasidium subglaciale]|nr:hypothetical protein E4T47_02557 [Aureobasidium subglaciale]